MSQSNKKDFFVNMIMAGIIVAAVQHGRGPDWAAGVMAEAMFVPEDALPDDLAEVGHMALDFVKWQRSEFGPQPDWYKDAWSHGW